MQAITGPAEDIIFVKKLPEKEIKDILSHTKQKTTLLVIMIRLVARIQYYWENQNLLIKSIRYAYKLHILLVLYLNKQHDNFVHIH